MRLWKQLLLSAYYYGSLPQRRTALRRREREGRAPVMILFYHRVADDHPNGWTISTARFEKQVRWMQRHFDLVSLEEAQQRIRSGENHRPAVSITFDDGYADNCQHAIPLLIKQQIPCTYFVCTQHVVGGHPFPHDVARGCPLRPNSIDELRAMAEAGIEIGAHTRTHCDLGQPLGAKRLRDEVITASEELQTAIGRPVRYFAFPYGQHRNLCSEAFQLADEAGFEAVCSAYGGYNLPGDDSFHLQRIHGDEVFLRIKDWLVMSDRKARSVSRYRYVLPAAPAQSDRVSAP